MNIEKDFIMREVQKIVQVLQVIMGLKQEKMFAQAMDEIDNIYARFFDENMRTIQAKDIEEFERLCTKGGCFSPDLAFVLADVMKEEAEILELQDENTAALQKYESALTLYQRVLSQKEGAVPVHILNTLEYLKGKAEKLGKII
ncbi:MAG: hypothetical protein JXR26_02485 [Balneolaceae bacterium]|nr:hypothetical protein [Balneolaceae bacterium]